MKYKMIFTTIFLSGYILSFAQNNPFTPEQLRTLSLQAKDYLIDFTKVVELLSDPVPVCDSICRQYRIEGTVKHFKQGATIKIITLNNKTPKNYSIATFLNSIAPNYSHKQKLANLSFDQIVIDFKSIREIKNTNGKTEYHAKGYCLQKFCEKKINDGDKTNVEDKEDFVLCEMTNKEMDIVITKSQYVSIRQDLVAILGDISVILIDKVHN